MILAATFFCFSLFLSSTLGLPLAQRDVVAPHITNPRKGTIWMVGQRELVEWETDNLPPDSQITNPNGRVILGYQANDSLNLDLDHPLAQNFKLRAGNVTIIVPNVPPRDDYIIVLMGDSGNASPAFAITSIRGGSSSSSASASGTLSSSSSASASRAPSSPSHSDNSPPFTGSVITGASTTNTLSATPSVPMSIVPVSSPSSDPVSSSVTMSATMLPLVSVPVPLSSGTLELATVASSGAGMVVTSTSSAWSIRSHNLWTIIATYLALALLI